MKIGLEFVIVGVVSAAFGIGVTILTRTIGMRDLHTRMDRMDGRLEKLIRVLSDDPLPEEPAQNNHPR